MREILNDGRAAVVPVVPQKPAFIRNPFSLLLYYRRNIRRILPITLILILSFFGVAMPSIFMGEIINSPQKVLQLFHRVALVWPNGFEGYTTLDAGRVRALDGAGAVYPAVLQWTYWPSIVGDTPGATNVFGLAQVDMQPVIDRLDAKLTAGRLPQPYSPEITMYAPIAKRRGLSIGDKINPQESLEELGEEFTIVGLIEGPAPFSILSREYLLQNSPKHPDEPINRSWLVFPKQADVAAGYPTLDTAIRNWPNNEAMVRTLSTQTTFVNDFTASLNMLLIALVSITVIVISLAVGLLNYVYFMRRLSEFGIQMALGLTRARLMRRAFSETLVMIGATWLLGFVLAEVVCRVLNYSLFEAQGFTVSALSPRALLSMLPVALLGSVSFLATTFWQLSRLDPVGIIEQRD